MTLSAEIQLNQTVSSELASRQLCCMLYADDQASTRHQSSHSYFAVSGPDMQLPGTKLPGCHTTSYHIESSALCTTACHSNWQPSCQASQAHTTLWLLTVPIDATVAVDLGHKEVGTWAQTGTWCTQQSTTRRQRRSARHNTFWGTSTGCQHVCHYFCACMVACCCSVQPIFGNGNAVQV